MTLEEYRAYCAEIKEDLESLISELNYIAVNDRVKSASGRARKKTVELGKKFKDFRKVSVEFCKQ